MTGARGDPSSVPPSRDGVTLDVVIPVYNEEAILESSVRRLRNHLDAHVPFPARITIVESHSADRTLEVARRLEADVPGVGVIQLDRAGKGFAVRKAWSQSTAPVVVFMDVDLSTDLAALLPLVAPLISGHSDVAVGTRHAPSARVARGAKRELMSRVYNLLLRLTLGVGFSDAQCGFKAMRSDRAAELLPLVVDDTWFFDSELLVLAERAGMRIHEVPVDWVDDPDSRVKVGHAMLVDLKGIVRLGWSLATGSVRLPAVAAAEPDAAQNLMFRSGAAVRFGLFGLAAAALHLTLYLATRSFAGPQWANAISVLMTSVVRTSAGRRAGAGPSRDRPAPALQSLVTFGIGLGVTAASLVVLGMVAPGAPLIVEVAALALADTIVTLIVFRLSRAWTIQVRQPGRPNR